MAKSGESRTMATLCEGPGVDEPVLVTYATKS